MRTFHGTYLQMKPYRINLCIVSRTKKVLQPDEKLKTRVRNSRGRQTFLSLLDDSNFLKISDRKDEWAETWKCRKEQCSYGSLKGSIHFNDKFVRLKTFQNRSSDISVEKERES